MLIEMRNNLQDTALPPLSGPPFSISPFITPHHPLQHKILLFYFLMIIAETILQSFALAAAIVATLRAGSRALYFISHEHEIGILDGPLILSPLDVKELKEAGETSRGTTLASINDKNVQVSPLWELTFGFSEAVRLLHNANENNSNDDHYHRGGSGRGTIIKKSSWMEESQTGYSMSSPHKQYHNDKSILVDSTLIENRDNQIVQVHDDNGSINEQRMIVVSQQDNEYIIKPQIHNYKEKISQLLIQSALFGINTWKRTSHLANQLLAPNPFPLRRQFDYDYSSDTTHTTLEHSDKDESTSDYDTIYSTTISIPLVEDDDLDETVMIENNKNNVIAPKVAKVKVFAPQTFERLRCLFGVTEKAFLKSILHCGPYVSFQSNSKGAARVGGFFFFTRDGTYMVKTIKKAEIKTILQMLPKYHTFMIKNARQSLLTRFCGLYSVQLSRGEKVEDEHVFLIMNSVFPAEGSKFISERFDLKGSTVGRECSLEERTEKGNQAVLKDLDLAREVNVMKSLSPSFGIREHGISIGPVAKAALLSQLRRDVKLLKSCSVMDYSLLVGVVNLETTDFNKNSDLPLKNEIKRVMSRMKGKHQQRLYNLVRLITFPARQLIAPVSFMVQILYQTFISILSSVLTPPFPYYGAGVCGVDGGSLSILQGKRLGNRAIYYMGVIDFLQPWTTQKILEKEFKGLMGYEKAAISCAHPRDYAERFLDFLDQHIT